MLLQVNDQIKRFVTVYNLHFPKIQVDDCIHYDDLKEMCRKMRSIDNTWWPSKATGPNPMIALRSKPCHGSGPPDPNILAAYVGVEEVRYKRIVEPIIGPANNNLGVTREFNDARGLIGAVITVLSVPISTFIVLSCTSASIMYRLLSSLVVALIVAIAEGYFIVKKLA